LIVLNKGVLILNGGGISFSTCAVAEAMTNKSIIFLKRVKHNNGIADNKYNELNNTIIMPKMTEYDLLYLKQTGIISFC
jgi:hypothetical protein